MPENNTFGSARNAVVDLKAKTTWLQEALDQQPKCVQNSCSQEDERGIIEPIEERKGRPPSPKVDGEANQAAHLPELKNKIESLP